VLSLVLVSTSPATAGERNLPSATERFSDFFALAKVDWSDRGSVIEYLVAYKRMLAGGARPFDEVAWRELVRRDVERARDIAASQNHSLIADGQLPSAAISSIAVPTLVIHGSADPMFPARARRSVGGGDPGSEPVDPRGSRAPGRSRRLGAGCPGDPRAHRPLSERAA
jgi:pimeloyl-ACP methyl ester carboxylesterase